MYHRTHCIWWSARLAGDVTSGFSSSLVTCPLSPPTRCVQAGAEKAQNNPEDRTRQMWQGDGMLLPGSPGLGSPALANERQPTRKAVSQVKGAPGRRGDLQDLPVSASCRGDPPLGSSLYELPRRAWRWPATPAPSSIGSTYPWAPSTRRTRGHHDIRGTGTSLLGP